MLRALASLIGLASFATLLAQGIVVGVLAYRGQLTAESVASIGDVLAGRPPAPPAAEPSTPATAPSSEEVEAERTIHTLELNARADDLRLLKDLLAADAGRLAADRATYERARQEFETRLAEVRARATEEATEQTRLVVKAMPAREAVVYLLSIPEPDALRIVKGLPERTTAKILQEFAAGTDEERQRGQSLFEAISAGRPEADIADAARAALPASPAGDPGG
ncbi:MAG TPA: hypothetical protein VF170_05495 [Planctomycetaceae bacterium]